MKQDQIDSQQDFSLLDKLPPFDASVALAPQLINLNGQANLQVLAGLLDTNISMIYGFRQNGKLPPNSDATYKDCIRHHLTWWKNRAAQKANNLVDASLLQEMKLREAKIEREWLAVKKSKEELLDVTVLAELLEPVFLGVRTQLCSLARKHPEIQTEIDNLLESWQKAGKDMFEKADREMTSFIEEMVSKEVDLETLLEGNLESLEGSE